MKLCCHIITTPNAVRKVVIVEQSSHIKFTSDNEPGLPRDCRPKLFRGGQTWILIQGVIKQRSDYRKMIGNVAEPCGGGVSLSCGSNLEWVPPVQMIKTHWFTLISYRDGSESSKAPDLLSERTHFVIRPGYRQHRSFPWFFSVQ